MCNGASKNLRRNLNSITEVIIRGVSSRWNIGKRTVLGIFHIENY